MFNLTLIESDCPVRRVVTHRSRNLECSRELSVNAYFFGCVQILGKFSLNTLFGRTVCKHIILNCFLCKERLVEALCVLFGGKDSAVLFALYSIVGNMLDYHRCLLLVDKPYNLCDKFLRVIFEHIELVRSYTL